MKKLKNMTPEKVMKNLWKRYPELKETGNSLSDYTTILKQKYNSALLRTNGNEKKAMANAIRGLNTSRAYRTKEEIEAMDTHTYVIDEVFEDEDEKAQFLRATGLKQNSRGQWIDAKGHFAKTKYGSSFKLLMSDELSDGTAFTLYKSGDIYMLETYSPRMWIFANQYDEAAMQNLNQQLGFDVRTADD